MHNVLLVEIGLTDLPKPGWGWGAARAPLPGPPWLRQPCNVMHGISVSSFQASSLPDLKKGGINCVFSLSIKLFLGVYLHILEQNKFQKLIEGKIHFV